MGRRRLFTRDRGSSRRGSSGSGATSWRGGGACVGRCEWDCDRCRSGDVVRQGGLGRAVVGDGSLRSRRPPIARDQRARITLLHVHLVLHPQQRLARRLVVEILHTKIHKVRLSVRNGFRP